MTKRIFKKTLFHLRLLSDHFQNVASADEYPQFETKNQAVNLEEDGNGIIMCYSSSMKKCMKAF